ncbi:MAG: hypothetical protein HYY35_07335 [Deltaproteobacteria bacterium]|nr:hypothetical protein [Deltaproteobacteria bacterium]
MIAVALDTAGGAAVREWIRPSDLASRPKEMMELMGWGPELVARAAAPTFPCLIDERHLLAELYDLVNVPMAVWIDERGRIVRPAEPAGAGDSFRKLDMATFTVPPEAAELGRKRRGVYVDALRDWVEKGDRSEHALAPEEVRRRVRGPSGEHARAAAEYRLGVFLYRAGRLEAAKRHLAEAVRLRPESWNYRRNHWMLDPGAVGELNAGPEFWQAVQALGERDYYAPIDMAGMPPAK